LVPKFQFALKDEGLYALGSEPSNGSGSQSLGLDKVVLDLMSLLIALENIAALLSMAFVIGTFVHGVSRSFVAHRIDVF